MEELLRKFVILSLLVVSLEGAADIEIDSILHGDESTHAQEFGHGLNAHGGELSDAELDGDHCQHRCHGHCVVVPQLASYAFSLLPRGAKYYLAQNPINPTLAPPTPPPDA